MPLFRLRSPAAAALVVTALTVAACSGEPGSTGGATDSAGADTVSADVVGASDGVADAAEASDVAAEDATAADAVTLDSVAPDSAAPDAGGADSAAPDTTILDAGPQDVFALPAGTAVNAIVTTLSKGPWVFAAPVPGDVAFAVDGKGALQLVGPLEGQVDAVSGSVSKPRTAFAFDKLVYVADAIGLHAVLSGKLKASPLNPLLPKGTVSRVLPVDMGSGVDLWLVVGQHLVLYRDSKLYTVTAPKLDATGADLSYGATVDGGPALWVGGPSGLHAVRVSAGDKAGQVTAWHYLADRAVVGVHVDAKGRVWAASKGELLRRDAPGQWTTHVLDDPVTQLWGRPGDGGFWLLGGKGISRWEAEDLHPVNGAPAVAIWRLDPQGHLVGLDAKGALVRLQTTEPVAKPPVTWKGDIEPLFTKACKLCHGEDGVNTKLHVPAEWKKRYDKILKNVTSGAMPLPPNQPLTPGEIALIKTWKKDGFKESP